jgi:hypothetical protein
MSAQRFAAVSMTSACVVTLAISCGAQHLVGWNGAPDLTAEGGDLGVASAPGDLDAASVSCADLSGPGLGFPCDPISHPCAPGLSCVLEGLYVCVPVGQQLGQSCGASLPCGLGLKCLPTETCVYAIADGSVLCM